MRLSLFITGLILISGIVVLRYERKILEALRAEEHVLAGEAHGLGRKADGSSSSATPTKRHREVGSKRAPENIGRVLAILRAQHQAVKDGVAVPGGTLAAALTLAEALEVIPDSSFSQLIAEVWAAEELDYRLRKRIIQRAFQGLGERSPEAALNLALEHSAILSELRIESERVLHALRRFTAENPLAAADWVLQHEEKYPGLITDAVKRGAAASAAPANPALAFRLAKELGIQDHTKFLRAIISRAGSTADRLSTVVALREHLAGMPQGENRAKLETDGFKLFGNILREMPFTSATEWLAEANLGPQEKEAFVGGLFWPSIDKDQGEWIRWFGNTLPPETRDQRIGEVVNSWTRSDFHAAGTWLAQAPDDAVKVPAVLAYVEAVAPYEPENAEQWALTLSGDDLDAALEAIHQQWPKGEVDAKASFAERHGIK